MASPTWWTWVWASCRSWWWTGKLGILQSMGSQIVGHDWATEDWIESNPFSTLWEKARVGCFKRTASKHVYYLGWNRSPAQAGWSPAQVRQALGPGALGRPRGSGWRGRWEGGSGWGTHVNPWLFHFNVWQNSLPKKKKSNPFSKINVFKRNKPKGCRKCLVYNPRGIKMYVNYWFIK